MTIDVLVSKAVASVPPSGKTFAGAVVAQFEGLDVALMPALSSALRDLVDSRLGGTPAQILDALIGALERGSDTGTIQSILTAAVWSTVQDEWNALKAKLVAKLPDKVKALAAQLRDLGSARDLPLVSVGRSAAVGPYGSPIPTTGFSRSSPTHTWPRAGHSRCRDGISTTGFRLSLATAIPCRFSASSRACVATRASSGRSRSA